MMPQQRPQRKPALGTIEPADLLRWYDEHARALPWRVPPAARRAGQRPDPYRVWLSEIMLQQTTVAAVDGYFRRFIARWPGVADLAAAPLDHVLAEWAGLGYYARARNMHAAARTVVAERGGRFPETAEGLQDLPGLGPYTAAAVAAICHDERVAVVDGNVERVMSRILALKTPIREAKPVIRAEVQKLVPTRAGDFAQAMMDLGATVCAPRTPDCGRCPIRSGCRALAEGDPSAYPVRAPKVERPRRFGHAFVYLREDGGVWLVRRPPKGLLGGMAGLPGSAWTAQPVDVDLPAGAWHRSGQVMHVFTHFALTLDVWTSRVPPGGPEPAATEEGWWAGRRELARQGLPSLFRKVLVAALGQEKTADREIGGQ